MSKDYNKGRRQGQRDGFIGSVLNSTMRSVVGNMGSKKQKEFNRGYDQGQKDRRQGNRRPW